MLHSILLDLKNMVLVFTEADGTMYRRPVRINSDLVKLSALCGEEMINHVCEFDFVNGIVVTYCEISYDTDLPYPVDDLVEEYREERKDLIGKSDLVISYLRYEDYQHFDLDLYELENKGFCYMSFFTNPFVLQVCE